jgi:hypothetical protein
MEKAEAKSSVKALYLQAAALAGLEVGPDSPERLASIVEEGFRKVSVTRRPEAVANTLRLIAATVESAQKRGDKMLHETNVDAGQDEVCPVYPFRKRK